MQADTRTRISDFIKINCYPKHKIVNIRNNQVC